MSADGPSRTALLVADTLGALPPADRLAALREEPVLLAVGPDRAETRRGQVMLATAASVIGRLLAFAPAIDVDAGGVRVVGGVPPLASRRPLAMEIVTMLRAIPPHPGTYRYRAAATRGRRYGVALIVGDVPAGIEAETLVCVDGDGWRAHLGAIPAPLGGAPAGAFNPFGPLVAAALGAAGVARAIFRRLAPAEQAAVFAPHPGTVTWDLWTHEFDAGPGGPPLPETVHLGRVGIVGLGALGAAATWALAHLEGACGTVELIDDDHLSASNLERVLSAFGRDVGLPKARLAARWLRDTGLTAVPIVARHGEPAAPGTRAPTLVVGVDTAAARRALSRRRPRAVYHGGTQSSELLVSRHVAGAGPCLECFYPEPATTPGAVEAHPCSRAAVVDDLPEATIAFVSALCGFLMACELVKDRVTRAARRGPLDPEHPVLRLDPLRDRPAPAIVERYVPRRDCPCRAW